MRAVVLFGSFGKTKTQYERMKAMQEQGPVTVAVVNAHPAECVGLATLLAAHGNYRVVHQVAHGEALLDALAGGLVVQLALVEVGLTAPTGYDTLERLAAGYPAVRVLACATAPTDADVLRTYRMGGRALLGKDAGVDELYRALEAVHHAGVYHTEATQRVLLENPDGLSPLERQRNRLLDQLPPRGLEVLRLICRPDDLTYQHMAEELKIGRRTVETYVNRLFEVFGVRSKTALALGAVRLGIVRLH